MTDLRPELPDPPRRIARLPVDDRGYPVPWFVAWVGDPPKPDFRVIGEGKMLEAIRFSKCWICGDELGKHVAFVIGAMCAVNRVSAEPPSHRECAEYAVRACPFLVRPHMVRRENDLPEDAVEPGGIMLRRNPGVGLVWITGKTKSAYIRSHGIIFVGEPTEISWYSKGRLATREEVLESLRTGLPALEEHAKAQDAQSELNESTRAQDMLKQQYELALKLIPAQSVIRV